MVKFTYQVYNKDFTNIGLIFTIIILFALLMHIQERICIVKVYCNQIIHQL